MEEASSTPTATHSPRPVLEGKHSGDGAWYDLALTKCKVVSTAEGARLLISYRGLPEEEWDTLRLEQLDTHIRYVSQ